MESGDFKAVMGTVIAYLKEIARNTNDNACCQAITSAGVNTSIPAGFGSVSIILVSGSIDIVMSDGSIYPMTVIGESLLQSGSVIEKLPAYIITGTGTWKWSAVN